MWFGNVETDWVTSFPLSVPVVGKKEVGVLGSKPSKGVEQNFASEFVEVSSNQRWTSQNFGFSQTQAEALKKTVKLPPASPELLSLEPPCDISLEDESPQNLYKTELCRSFEETGSCRYGLKCQFAHGRAELRVISRHPKYKTEVCKTFHTIGTCPYGKRCRFIHIEAPVSPQTAPVKLPPKIEIKSPIKPPAFENIPPTSSSWTNNWTGPSPLSTPVNFIPVVKGRPAITPVDPLSTMKSNEFLERRSRLGFFQQFCS